MLLGLDEANIVESGDGYLYAEFTSRLMRYVDDVEFLEDSTAGVIHVRSASRLGYTTSVRTENASRTSAACSRKIKAFGEGKASQGFSP